MEWLVSLLTEYVGLEGCWNNNEDLGYVIKPGDTTGYTLEKYLNSLYLSTGNQNDNQSSPHKVAVGLNVFIHGKALK